MLKESGSGGKKHSAALVQHSLSTWWSHVARSWRLVLYDTHYCETTNGKLNQPKFLHAVLSGNPSLCPGQAHSS